MRRLISPPLAAARAERLALTIAPGEEAARMTLQEGRYRLTLPLTLRAADHGPLAQNARAACAAAPVSPGARRASMLVPRAYGAAANGRALVCLREAFCQKAVGRRCQRASGSEGTKAPDRSAGAFSKREGHSAPGDFQPVKGRAGKLLICLSDVS